MPPDTCGAAFAERAAQIEDEKAAARRLLVKARILTPLQVQAAWSLTECDWQAMSPEIRHAYSLSAVAVLAEEADVG